MKASVNQFITSAAAEKKDSLMIENYLRQRAEKGQYEDFKSVLDMIPDFEPEKYNRILNSIQKVTLPLGGEFKIKKTTWVKFYL